ncbi:MAG TPA: chemotaxis protein CheB [Sandaracinaceae bacterium LLY-WYZ-13_1]|nr:chemotaxis protein CheB [Sandaracinaceae bacterium LLY-WYZ-13_1]
MSGDGAEEAPATLVVGVGASAGGLAAFQALLDVLRPGRGMAFLLVQHLDPRHESMLAELLEPRTELRVRTAGQDMPLEPDTVYVIQPGTALAVERGRIRLSEPELRRGLRLPVDHLFRSLAREHGSRAVGIVLSGAGSDGSDGLRAIQAAGGLTIAQAPDSAGQAGMPRSAIDVGAADLAVEIEQIPDVLERFAALPPSARAPAVPVERPPPSDSPVPLDPGTHARLATLLEQREGFGLRAYKQATVQRRLWRRMALIGHREPEAYLEALRQDPEERQAFVRDLLIGVTEFFRDPEAFRALRRWVIEPLVEELPAGRTLRVWVPGCATGEEAYSVGMECLDAIDTGGSELSLQVFATDVDRGALSVGRAAVYPPSIEDQISKARLDRYFEPLPGAGHRVRPRLRDAVSFAAQDLTSDAPFSRMHLVSCRNVLIYLTPETQRRVLGVLHFALEPEGYLFLSSSETTAALRDHFVTVSKKHRIYQKLGVSRPLGFLRHHTSASARGRRTASPPSSARESRTAERAHDLERRALIAACVPPAVLVSGDDDVLYLHGELSPYLRLPQGRRPRLELSTILRPGVAARVRGAIHRSRRTGEPVDARASAEPGVSQVRVGVRPAEELGPDAVVITFEREEQAPPSPRPETTEDEPVVHQLERELEATREDLRNTVEELETANEELRTSSEESLTMNEELQSANEELEASAEELRSLNEELTTVNAQLREKVEQLEEARADLANVLASTRIPTLILNERLQIERLTPVTRKALGLSEAHRGWAVRDVARPGLGDGLTEEARAVLDDFRPRSREVVLEGGRVAERRVLPYRTERRRVAGVVVAWIDVTEIHRTTEALRKSEERFRLATEAARLGTFDLDLETGDNRWSPTLKRLFGLTADAREPSSPMDAGLIHPDDTARVRALQEASFDPAGDGAFEDEHRIVRADGRVRWVYVRSRTRFEGEGTSRRAVRAVGAVIDVTERKEAERALAESEARMRRLFDQAPALIAVHEGPEHTYLYSNPPHDRAVGERALVGRSLRDAMPELEGQGVFERFDRVYAEGEPVATTSFPATVRKADGSDDRRHYTQVLQPWFDAAGAVAGVMSFAFDVTEEVALRRHVERSEQRLRIAKDAAELGVYDLDPVSGRVAWDARTRELWGVPEDEEMTLEGALESVHPDDLEQTRAAVDRAFDPEGDGRYESEYRVVNRRDGRVRWIRATGVVSFEDGAAVRLVGTVEDVTERREAERALRASREALREADRRKDEFIAMLGHELRNPLAAIRGAADVLESELGGEPRARRAGEVLHRQSAHMTQLLDGLLDVSRIVRGKMSMARERVDLAALCRRAVADARSRLDERGPELRAHLPDEPVWLDADPVRMTQVVDNLLSNACKYTRDGELVSFELRHDEEEAVLEVRDAGVGIDPALLPHVFETFWQSEQSIDRAEGGLGLGLSLVRGIVRLHGGTVTAHSEGAGRGARFVVRLPLAPAVEDADERPSEAPSFRPLTLLVIEDDEDVAEMMAQSLAREGHRVEVAEDGRAGVARAKELSPDVVVCDIGLPDDMSGHDVARALRADPATRDAAMVALTGYGRREDRARSAEAGFDAHVTKPADLAALKALLQRLARDAESRA